MRGPEIVEATLVSGGAALWLAWDDGFSEVLPGIWFCDNADDAFDPVSGQRRRSLSDCDPDVELESVALHSDALLFRTRPGGAARMARHRLQARRRQPMASPRWLSPEALTGFAPTPAGDFLTGDEALRETLARLTGWGVALLTGADARSGVVEALVARFGFVRETNYGRLFDVRSEAVPSNLAYTAQGLDLHTDNPYREPVPTLQLLHAIRSDAFGGETCFVDGFAQAEAMRDEEPGAFALLSGQPVDFQYAAPDGAAYRARRPVIALDAEGAVQAVHLNHRALAPLAMAYAQLPEWYAAYRSFHHRVHQPTARLSLHLKPGDVAVFDNCRILHGRTAFQPGAGGRWLQGCYADMDGARATLARLGRTPSPKG